MSQRQLHFNAFIWPNGYHESAWRVVDDDVRNGLGLPYYADIARTYNQPWELARRFATLDHLSGGPTLRDQLGLSRPAAG